MYYQKQIQLGILFLIATLFTSACNTTTNKPSKSNKPKIESHSISNSESDFDRENELYTLLNDLDIEINSGFILYIPPTHCSNCLRKTAVGLDSLISLGDKVVLLYAKQNKSICSDYQASQNFLCSEYDGTKIEEVYGFYYWDPLVFSFSENQLTDYKIL